MQFSTIFGLAAFLAVGTASPVNRRTGSGVIVFHGAAGAQYTLTVPLDGTNTLTRKFYPPLYYTVTPI